ncbi:MAG: outer membrane beta-barrel protein [Flavobacteriales bacterium]|jgi:hypothetical protein
MRLVILLVLLPFAAVSQAPSQKKIIIITNKDTTILESDIDQVDSLIEWNMKSIYRMGNALGEFPSEFQVEVFIDSVFKEVETAKGFKEKNHEGNSVRNGENRTIRIEKHFDQKQNNPNPTIEEEVIIERSPKIMLNPLNKEIDFLDRSDLFKEKKAHWAGFTVGLNGLLNADGRLAKEADAPFLVLDYAKSFSFQLNFWEKRVPIFKDFIGVTSGIGVLWNRFEMQKNIDLFSNMDSIYATVNTLNNYRTNALNITFLQIPLLLEVNTHTNPDKNWNLALGVVGGMRIGANWKTKWEVDASLQKAKSKDDFNLNALLANAYAQVGYGNVGLFFQYGLTDVFQKNKGPELRSFTAGLKLHF